MSSGKRSKEKWEYASLEWIHRARDEIYKEEKGRPLTKLAPGLSRRAAAITHRLKLKTIRGAKLPIRRRRSD